MLVGETDTEAEVAFRVGAFELDCYTLFLVARQQYVGVKPGSAVDSCHRFHLDVDESKYSQSAQRLIGPVDVGGVVRLTGYYAAVFFEHRRTYVPVGTVEHYYISKMNGIAASRRDVLGAQTGVVVGYEDDFAHRIGSMTVGHNICALRRAMHARRLDSHHQSDFSRTGGGISHKGNVLFGEGIVAVVAKQLRDSSALCVKAVSVEGLSGRQQRACRICAQKRVDGRIGTFHAERRNGVPASRFYYVVERNAFLVGSCYRVDCD